MAIFHGVNQRQSDFALFQIAEDGLAELFTGSGEVQKIIHQLKGQTCVAAVFGEGFFVDVPEATQNSAEAGTAAEEAGGFVGGEFERIVFGDVHAADFGELQEFAFDHLLREINEDIEYMEIALFKGDLERLHIEPIAGENAAMIAPARIGGGASAAGVGAVNHIVVDEGGAVEEFDDGS